ncbi:AAA family ATPase [Pseudomonas sp. FP1742]|uniref:AAA family ATPase n=1 Tax=Pseudomonas sp. FP1742 TaxID=2954079 RepID=UPI002735CC8A|nr:AAA family ATPase [Pseudomonas sp. FP1742]WLG48621.1 AAA family ATPase [Pseudomonas sp. FP1742]
MKLVSLKYSENIGHDREWILNELTLGDKNLIVGRNSAGKSRTLHVLGSLARILTSSQYMLPTSCKYHCEWTNSSGSLYAYEYTVENSRITLERLTIDNKIYIDRKEVGFGVIYYEQVNGGTNLPFQSPENEFAIAKRRDVLQHSFIEPLHLWASELRHFFFGSAFGKDQLAVFIPNMPPVDERDSNQVVGLFRNAVRDFGDEFLNSILQDMQHLGYDLQSVELGFPVSIDPLVVPPGLNCIKIKEVGVRGHVDQLTMSQGMYRVLALLVNVNYLLLKKTSTCVIIDDIGEGLDFERSCKLISLLRQKAQDSNIQIIMSTNDRFVMNEVPLSEWTVLHRIGSEVHVSNYHNSKEKFDEFRFTGLSNFSFFEMDYLTDQGEEL